MDVVKAHVAYVVGATVISALLTSGKHGSSHIPYFPIEISLLAASGPVPLAIFRLGMASLGVTLFATKSLSVVTLGIWVGLLMIAGFEGRRHLLQHCAGIVVLVMFLGLHIYRNGLKSKTVIPFVMGGLIMLLRLAAKSFAVLILEHGWPTSLRQFLLPSTYLNVKTHAVVIMEHGSSACKYHPEAIEAVFAVGGALQWVMFYSLSRCL